ncbi:MAG: MarR family transcriptional regulator [Mobilitalea sp.]
MMYCKVTEQIFGITRLLEDEKKKPKDYGNGVLLYHAEVQLLDIIARYPSDNVSALSERLGITKGAITQMVEKLRQKELIETVKREDNKKEKYFCLTDKGEISIQGHQQLHQQANTSLCEFVSTLNPGEADAVFRFLEHLKLCVPFCEFQCTCKHDDVKDKEENHDESNIIECARVTRRA